MRATLDPELQLALSLHEMPVPDDPVVEQMMLDRPFQFGDCPTDNIQGVLNIARNAPTILRAPVIPRVTCPVIAIGGGPSLGRHIAALRRLQHKCVLIASASSIAGLRAEGIEPHASTPMERTEDMPDYMAKDCGETRFIGAPLVCKTVMDRFKHHCYVGNSDPLYDWCSLPSDTKMYYGSSTGTMAAAVGCEMTKNTVYLVGHDLAIEDGDSHWGPSQGIRMTADAVTIQGNNGKTLPTNTLWHRYAVTLEECGKAHGNVANVNGPDHIGARLRWTKDLGLPDPDSLPDMHVNWGERSDARYDAWCRHARTIDRDARKAVQFMRTSQPRIMVISGNRCLTGTDVTQVIHGPNGKVFSYIMRGLYAQLSYQVRMRITDEMTAHRWAQQGIINVLHNSRRIFEEIASYAIAG